MNRTSEEVMLLAALNVGATELARLARDMTSADRRLLTKALNRVYEALVEAEDRERGEG